MTPQQIKRMGELENIDPCDRTEAQKAELISLFALHNDLTQAFYLLRDNGMHPTWVGGQYIIANPPLRNQVNIYSYAQARALVQRVKRRG